MGEAEAALARLGRYRTVAGSLRIKDVKPRHDQGVMADLFIVCHNPDQAERDQVVRGRFLAQLRQKIADSDALTTTKRAELRGTISTMPDSNRYLRVTPTGLLRVDAAAIPCVSGRCETARVLLPPFSTGREQVDHFDSHHRRPSDGRHR